MKKVLCVFLPVLLFISLSCSENKLKKYPLPKSRSIGLFQGKKAALLIIDLQKEYFPLIREDMVMDSVISLIDKAKKAGVPVIYIHNSETQSPELEFVDSIKPGKNDIVINKRRPDSFVSTDLKEVLDKLDIDVLVLTGIATNYCYGFTAKRALTEGYETVVVEDGHTVPVKMSKDIPIDMEDLIVDTTKLLNKMGAQVSPAANIEFTASKRKL